MDRRKLIVELNRLWDPVRPYLAQQVVELWGRNDGRVLEAGPFSGLAFELAARSIGTSWHMAVFPREALEGLRDEARELGLAGTVTITESDEALRGVAAETFDLVIFRGAFFFPSFFKPDLRAIYRSLKAGGVAILGGGFGSSTTKEIISSIEKRSKELNEALGRVRVTERELWSTLETAELKERATMIAEGGLWVVLRKECSPPTSAQAGQAIFQA